MLHCGRELGVSQDLCAPCMLSLSTSDHCNRSWRDAESGWALGQRTNGAERLVQKGPRQSFSLPA